MAQATNGSLPSQSATEIGEWYSRHSSDTDEVSVQAHVLLHRAYMAISTRNQVGKESDFSSGRFNVLRLLDQAGEQGLLMTDIAAGLNMSITNLPKLMDDLAARKLITRVRDKDDGRKRWAQLTPEGRRLLEDQVPRAALSIRKAWSLLTKREKKQLVDLLGKIDAKLDGRA